MPLDATLIAGRTIRPVDSRARGVSCMCWLLALRIKRRWRQLVGFAAVGAGGAAVNTGVLALLTRDAHVWYLIASVLATQIAILFNFTLSEWLVFRHTQPDKSLPSRLASYLIVNDASLLISGPLLLLLVALGTDLLLANALVLVLLCLGRFAIADSYIWGGRSFYPRRSAASHPRTETRTSRDRVLALKPDRNRPRCGRQRGRPSLAWPHSNEAFR